MSESIFGTGVYGHTIKQQYAGGFLFQFKYSLTLKPLVGNINMVEPKS